MGFARLRGAWIGLLAIALLASFGTGIRAEEGEKEKKDDFPKIAEKTEGMEKLPGFLTLYYDKDEDRLYGEFAGPALKDEFQLSTSASAGLYAGSQWGEDLLKLEVMDKEVLFVVPNTFYTAKGELKDVVERTYPDQVIAKAPILAKTNGNILIDMKALLAGQADAFVGRITGFKVSQVAKAKSFPDNTIVEIRFRGPDGALGIAYSFGRLPKTDYKPRVADQRVGYFLTARTNFSKDPEADTMFDRYINRWDLEKADKSLKLSPPKEPLVFYIEKSVPIRYRRYVREGIEEWNKAFEKIGIADAIVVRQQTESNEFADLDPEDARYNFFRWVTNQGGYAQGPSRVDPRTGQIFDADIIMDDSMVRYYLYAYDVFVRAAAQNAEYTPKLRQWLAQNPEEHPLWNELQSAYAMRIQEDPRLAGQTPRSLFAQDIMADTFSAAHGGHFCSIGQVLGSELAFAGLGLDLGLMSQAENKKAKDGDDKGDDDKDDEEKKDEKDPFAEWPEEFIGGLVREIVAHEVGHTLGLRHNFKASSWKTYNEIIETSDREVPTVASIMDYNPYSLKADGTPPDVWITQSIGPYDEWAIEYGYAIAGTGDYPSGEDKMLSQILDKATEHGHEYGTDEDVASPDPTINRFDLGKDPLVFAQERMKLANNIMERLLDVAVKDDESYDKARRAYETLFWQRYSVGNLAAKHIGGTYLYRDHKGDPNARPPIVPVDAEKQREAIRLISEHIFARDAFKIDPEIQTHLAAGRWSHRGSSSWREPLVYPIQDEVLSMQRSIMFSLTNPQRIEWVYDAEMYVPADKDVFTLPELLDTLTASIWTEVKEPKGADFGDSFTARKPMITNLRRNLQREYLGRLITIANGGERSAYPAIARTLAWKQLKDLGANIDEMLADKRASKLDPYTTAHLEESSMRIQKVLAADYVVGENGGSSGFRIIFGQPTPSEGAAQSLRSGMPPMGGSPYMR
ncbi:zinc-dependent metalloprotease [bacterium]|nr:zinc-dependent metalloprotease [bacterium]